MGEMDKYTSLHHRVNFTFCPVCFIVVLSPEGMLWLSKMLFLPPGISYIIMQLYYVTGPCGDRTTIIYEDYPTMSKWSTSVSTCMVMCIAKL